MGDEHILVDVARAVAVDDRILLGVQAATVARLVPITAIGEPTRVAVVADGQDLAEVRTGDYRTDFETLAGRSTGQAFRKLKVNLFKRGSCSGHRELRETLRISQTSPDVNGHPVP